MRENDDSENILESKKMEGRGEEEKHENGDRAIYSGSAKAPFCEGRHFSHHAILPYTLASPEPDFTDTHIQP